VHKNSRFQANTEILAVFYSEKYGDFVELIKFFEVIGSLGSLVFTKKNVCLVILECKIKYEDKF